MGGFCRHDPGADGTAVPCRQSIHCARTGSRLARGSAARTGQDVTYPCSRPGGGVVFRWGQCLAPAEGSESSRFLSTERGIAGAAPRRLRPASGRGAAQAALVGAGPARAARADAIAGPARRRRRRIWSRRWRPATMTVASASSWEHDARPDQGQRRPGAELGGRVRGEWAGGRGDLFG
jgi:hypothetical protein